MRLIKEHQFYLIVILLLIMIMAVRTPLDTDMWWHLRAGEQTWLDKQVYSVDTFSHTRAGAEWINHSWLSQLIMYGIFSLGDFFGLAIWVGLCAVISLGLIYRQMEGHPLLRGFGLLFAAVVSSVVWSPRPQLHSLVLFSALSLILYQFRKNKDWRTLAFVLPLFVLWGNLHGGYVLGLILIFAVISGEILNKILFEKNSLNWIQICYLIGAAVLGYAVVLINPFGFEMWKIPFNTVGVETLQNLINEWASPDFHFLFQQPMTWMMLGTFSLMALSGKKSDGVDVVTLAAFSWSALVARRNFGPFALVAAPIFVRYLNLFIETWLEKAKVKIPLIQQLLLKSKQNKGDLPIWINNLINLTAIGLLLFSVGWKGFYATGEKLDEAKYEIFPVAAVNWMNENPVQGNIFNDYNWGGYVIWHHRSRPVFVDGRTDLFGDVVLNDYLEVLNLGDDWENTLNAFDIHLIIIRTDSNLAKLLSVSNWKPAYQDQLAIIFVKE